MLGVRVDRTVLSGSSGARRGVLTSGADSAPTVGMNSTKDKWQGFLCALLIVAVVLVGGFLTYDGKSGRPTPADECEPLDAMEFRC